MPGPINVIKFNYNPKATLERHWSIVIDKKELVDLLEQAVTSPVRGHWPSKAKALVNLEDMQKSLEAQGELELLICANCSASGYRSCGDLDLQPAMVSQERDYVIWEMRAPKPDPDAGGEETLRYKFHRPQYTSEVTKLLKKK